MFYYLEGSVAVIEHNLAVIDCGGVGYGCFVSTNTLTGLELGKKVKLFTYCNIKEDAFDIFGFSAMSEKRCFEMLLSVSGVGPKAALSILSACTPETLAMAVVTDDVVVLTRAVGVGKKLAQRIVLELKDKVSKETQLMQSSGYVPLATGGKADEAHAALAVLGYSPAEISSLMRNLDFENMTTEEIIREALKSSLK
jgi:Holliday junction DNA helicase, RuvA subunit